MRLVHLGDLLIDCATIALADDCSPHHPLEAQISLSTAHDGRYPVLGLVTKDGRIIEITIDLDCFGWLDENGELKKQ